MAVACAHDRFVSNDSVPASNLGLPDALRVPPTYVGLPNALPVSNDCVPDKATVLRSNARRVPDAPRVPNDRMPDKATVLRSDAGRMPEPRDLPDARLPKSPDLPNGRLPIGDRLRRDSWGRIRPGHVGRGAQPG